MKIKCQICNKAFKLITQSHLSSHSISVEKYVLQFGDNSLSSDEFKKQQGDQQRGKKKEYQVWNKGIPMTEVAKKNLSEKNSGKIAWNKGIPMKEESKDKLRLSDEEVHRREEENQLKKQQRKIDLENEKNNTDQYWIKFIQDKGFSIIEQFDRIHYKLQCSKEGCNHIFETTRQNFYDSKYKTDSCQFCPIDTYSSRAQKEVFEWLKSENPNLEIQWENKSVVWPKEIDIYIPEFNLGIEYCGLYWHSEKNGVNKEYHKNKFLTCQDKGITLIQIFEDEWLSHKDIVKSIINSRLQKNTKLFARKTTVKEVKFEAARKFLTDTHIQGAGKARHYFACVYNDEIVSVMSFSKGNLSRKNMDVWEIERFSTKLNYTVVGAASKMLNAFIEKYSVEQLVSYADIRYGTGQVYEKIGFMKDKHTVPNYWYFKTNTKRYHRFSLRKNKDDNQNLTEWQNREQQGWNKIYDAGSNKYVLNIIK